MTNSITATLYEANAGTGKTYTLTKSILDAIVGGTPIQKICALTFTEKAANEMMERLRAKLAEFIANGELEPSQMQLADRCFVGTIHAFCLQILKRYVDLTGLPPVFEIDARGEVYDRLFEAKWDEFLSHILREPSPDEARIVTKLGISTLRSIADLMIRMRQDTNFIEDHSTFWLREDLRRYEKWGFSKGKSTWDAVKLGALKEYEKYSDVLSFLVESQPAGDEFDRAIRDLMRCRSEDIHLAIQVLRKKFIHPFKSVYHSSGYVTYDDLLVFARDLLRQPRVRRQLKEKYDLVLVDEMQDTDAVQYEIILCLCEKKDVHEDFSLRDLLTKNKQLQLEPEKLFVVGDPKQSIYSFRHADLNAYRLIKQVLFEAGAGIKPLAENYRSCSNLVEFTNNLAVKLFPYDQQTPSMSKMDYCSEKEAADCVHLVRIYSEDVTRVHLRILAEANWLAEKIKQLHFKESFEYKNIAILLRKLTSAHMYVDALGARNIQVVIEGEKYFYRSQEIVDFINLLKFIVDPHDSLALAGMLRSPLFGFDDRELAVFFIHLRSGIAEALQKTLEHKRERLEAVRLYFSRISEIRKDSKAYTPGKLIDQILLRLPILAIAGFGYGTYRSTVAPLNILKIHKQAVEADLDASMTMSRFVFLLEQNAKEGKDLGQEPLADETVNAVRVLSIHNSKGLDFPIVFLPLTDYETIQGRPPNDLLYDWQSGITGIKANSFTDAGYLKIRYEGDRPVKDETAFSCLEDEERRVLYVGATRAKERLYFCCVHGAGNGEKIFQGLRSVNPAIKEVDDKSSSTFPEMLVALPPAGPSMTAVQQKWDKLTEAAYTRSAPLITGITAEAKKDLEQDGLPEFSPAFDNSEEHRLIGILCHEVLEHIHFGKPNGWEQTLIHACEKYQDEFSRSQLDSAKESAHRILKGFLNSGAWRWLASCEILGREVPVFLFEKDKPKILSGKIDLVVRDQDQSIFVVDFKTDRKLDKTSLEKYRRQLNAYVTSFQPLLNQIPASRIIMLRTGEII